MKYRYTVAKTLSNLDCSTEGEVLKQTEKCGYTIQIIRTPATKETAYGSVKWALKHFNQTVEET